MSALTRLSAPGRLSTLAQLRRGDLDPPTTASDSTRTVRSTSILAPGPGQARWHARGDLIDEPVLEELQGTAGPDSTGFVSMLLTLWSSEVTGQLRELDRLLRRPDPTGAATVVHTMKGSSGTVGAVRVAQACAALEADLRADAPTVELSHSRLKDITRATQDAYRHLGLASAHHEEQP